MCHKIWVLFGAGLGKASPDGQACHETRLSSKIVHCMGHNHDHRTQSNTSIIRDNYEKSLNAGTQPFIPTNKKKTKIYIYAVLWPVLNRISITRSPVEIPFRALLFVGIN